MAPLCWGKEGSQEGFDGWLRTEHTVQVFSGGKLSSGAVDLRKAHAKEDAGEGSERMLILYGTQTGTSALGRWLCFALRPTKALPRTGTAEKFARELAAEAKDRLGGAAQVVVQDLDEYDGPGRLAQERLVLLLMATYGDGEPTDNAARFYDWLVKLGAKAEEDEALARSHESVTYGVFGLGNKQYEHFNAVGRKTDKALKALGAKQVVRRGDGDDDGCIEDDFAQWREELWPALDKTGLFQRAPLADRSNGGAPPASPGHKPAAQSYDVLTFGPGSVRETSHWVAPGPQYDTKAQVPDQHYPYLARIMGVRELHSVRSERSCVHVEIEVAGTPLEYSTGDHVGVYPENSPSVVAQAAKRLGWDLDQLFELKADASLPPPFPGPVTVRTALTRYADLLGVPRKAALLALAEFATDAKQRARLLALGGREGAAEYQSYIQKPLRSLLEVLEDFPSAQPPLGALFGSIAPRLQPRYYSISSSPARHPDELHITCAVVREQSATGRTHEGVCSNWFKRVEPGTRVPVFIRRSGFRLPRELSTPILMVGPGTGLAPFRAFLQDRDHQAKAGKPQQQPGRSLMYFGCRDRAKDYIYEEELADYHRRGICQLSVAFSREQSGKKEYVQHHLARDADEVWELLEQGVCLVCCKGTP